MRFLMNRIVNGGFWWGSGGEPPEPPVCDPLTTIQDQNGDFLLDQNGLCVQE